MTAIKIPESETALLLNMTCSRHVFFFDKSMPSQEPDPGYATKLKHVQSRRIFNTNFADFATTNLHFPRDLIHQNRDKFDAFQGCKEFSLIGGSLHLKSKNKPTQ